MNETRIPPSREVREHDGKKRHANAHRELRNGVIVFFLSLAGWITAAGLWWLGGKL